jgi:ABC-type polysaccharide/polyol phosphate transport system ATPase subunit
MADVVVAADRLGKRYLVGEDLDAYDTLRGAISRLAKRERPRRRPELWALRDVSFEVERGEVLGIVGANGSGKTTTLKLVSRITRPTSGSVRTRGRVGSVLEIGTGFHPELTGRENVLMNAAILGMSRRELRGRFDEIVDFSGIEPFIDTPLKRYSSGMRLRLAFAVVAHVEPEILAIDEVLAVGDAEFQRKCLGRMSELQREGRTVLFVSHDHGAVTQLCNRALWLDHGNVRAEGDPADVVASYLRSVGTGAGSATLQTDETGDAVVRTVAVLGPQGEAVGSLMRGEAITLRLEVEVARQIPGLDVSFYLTNGRGVLVIDEAWLDAPRPPLGPGLHTIYVQVPGILNPDRYLATVWVGDATAAFQEQEALSFEVLPRPEDRGDDYRIRVVRPEARWWTESAER